MAIGMTKRSSPAAKRAWSILRLSLLWARKGSVFRRRLIMDLNHVSRYLKTLKNTSSYCTSSSRRGNYIHYGERELSFDATPVIHVKMHRPASLRFKMPCIIKPEVDFDYDFETERGDDDEDNALSYDDVDEEYDHEEESFGQQCDDDEGVDERAEEFIANFYQQMRLQRQISYLQYTHDKINL